MCFLEKDEKLPASKLKWKKGDIDVHKVLDNWTLKKPSFEEHILPHEIFEKFFTTEEMERICLETNKYARHKGNRAFVMTIKKLKSFIAILMLSGYNQLPRQEMYWKRREDSQNRMVTALMTKNEFEECKQFLHLADNKSLDKTDRFAKVRPLFDAVNKQCVAYYKPDQHLSVDESMVPYFGKHGAKQYIHGKPIKFGYKLWVLAKPLGYCVQFCPYAGKDTQLDEYGDIGLEVGGTVVAHLLKCLSFQQDNGSIYHVVMDNFFTSPGLLCHLQKQPIAAIGTVRLCRMGNPPLKSVKEVKKLQRGTSVVAVETLSNVSAVRWKDNKVVNILSTFAGKEPQNKVKRYSQNKKKRIDILQPNVVNVYNRFMGGVDCMDQNISTYMIHLRSKKCGGYCFVFVLMLRLTMPFNCIVYANQMLVR